MPSIYSETNVSRTSANEDEYDDDRDGGIIVQSPFYDENKNNSQTRELLWHDEFNDDDYCLPLTTLLNQSGRESTVECVSDKQAGGGGDRLSPPVLRWSDSAVADIIPRATRRQHQHFLNKKRRPKFDVKHFRGTIMRAPSKRFIVWPFNVHCKAGCGLVQNTRDAY